MILSFFFSETLNRIKNRLIFWNAEILDELEEESRHDWKLKSILSTNLHTCVLLRVLKDIQYRVSQKSRELI